MVSRTSPLRSTVLSTSVSVLVLQARTTSRNSALFANASANHLQRRPGLGDDVVGSTAAPATGRIPRVG
jgi:hypothetical protein